MARTHILVTGRSKSAVDAIGASLTQLTDFRIVPRVVVNGHMDPLYGVEQPDIILLHHEREHYAELEFLAKRKVSERLPLLVCGPPDDAEAMRLAMQAGARDYLAEPIVERDLMTSIRRLGEEVKASVKNKSGTLIAFVNGKGGSGASFLAVNLARCLAEKKSRHTTLVDFDLQFGGLARYLDLSPERGVFEALEAVDEIDEIAIKAFIATHESNLRLLASIPSLSTLMKDMPVERVDALLQLLLAHNDYVVVDVPRRIDAYNVAVLERADHVALITQQSLGHIQDTARMMQILTMDLAIPNGSVRIVVNRYAKNAPVELSDLKKALHVSSVSLIPNQYRQVAESINVGVPIWDFAKTSPVSKAISQLQTDLIGGESSPGPTTFLRRALPELLRRQ